VLFASAPTTAEILDFRPSEQTQQRASELLELNRSESLDKRTATELDQYEQAELLMRLVKARIRSEQIRDVGTRERVHPCSGSETGS